MAKAKDDMGAYALSALRIGLGYIFLWAFLDKLFGLKLSTCKGTAIGCKQAWLHGGSPTAGFLGHAATGPFASFYHHLSGHVWVDWLFMLGLLFVGIGLFFGTWIKTAALAGVAMLALMWSALLWPTNAPGVDEHIIYILAMLVLVFDNTPQKWTLKAPWINLP